MEKQTPQNPSRGGTYREDPDTGELVRVGGTEEAPFDSTPPANPPAPSDEEF